MTCLRADAAIAGPAAAGLALDEEAGYPRRSYAWLVVALLMGTAILSYTDRQVLSLLVDPVRHDLGISDTSMSLLLGTAFALIAGFAGIPFGWLADRWSRRNLIVGGVLVWSIGTIACGLSHDFTQLFIARIVVGLGESVLSPAAISLISDYFPPSRRGLAVGSFLSGIAIGIGASILVGGATLHLVESGVLAASPLAGLSAWRLVLLLLGAPGFLWVFALFIIREPARRAAHAVLATDTGAGTGAVTLAAVAPLYVIVAMASLVDNAVGAWAPTLLIRGFARDAADVGVHLGTLLTIGFGAGVLLGGWLSDRAASYAQVRGKAFVCLAVSLLILPVAWAINAPSADVVMDAVPAYFVLSGIVTACGFSAILDSVPNDRRGLAMAISFCLNVAVGAGLGPTSVAYLSDHVFTAQRGLGPALLSTIVAGYGIVALAALIALLRRASSAAAAH